jgi:hypothetical protein
MTDWVAVATSLVSAAIVILGLISSHSKLAAKIDAAVVKAAPDVPAAVSAVETIAKDVESSQG